MTGSKQFGFGRLFRFSGVMLSAWLLSASAPVHAQASGNAGFDAYVQSLWPKAQAKGVSRATFDRVTAGLQDNARVVALDRDKLGAPSAREGVVQGKGVSVRVYLGGAPQDKK